LKEKKMVVAPKIGQILVKKKMISEEQLEKAIKEQEVNKAFLGSILVDHGAITEEQLMQALADQYKIPFVNLKGISVEKKVLEHIPVKVALHYKIVPLGFSGTKLKVAICQPQNIRLLDEFRMTLPKRDVLEVVLATEADILECVREHYGLGADMVDTMSKKTAKTETVTPVLEEKIEDIEKLAGDASIIKLVNQILLEAHQSRSTDIHLEPYREHIRLRYRIDGMLYDKEVPAAIRQFFPAIISRIKIMSNLDIVERRLPQDGRATVKVGPEKLDLRISILPTPRGESTVIRILPNTVIFNLEELGFQRKDLEFLDQIIQSPYGLIFVTGPTGSGKTTTLYAALRNINTEERKIITIEDPVEYELEGVTQVHINPKISLTFAQGLRSMLRHDPDVMMVGEVRDLETAELSIRIALTGHLVFSTLHTNDATSAVTRLMDMGIDPYLIASSAKCFIAQRLVRLICNDCKKEVPSADPNIPAFRGQGCEKCKQTGFIGRTAIYEILDISDPIKELILEKSSADKIRRKAMELGMVSIYDNGIQKVKKGLTTLDEILRVTQMTTQP